MGKFKRFAALAWPMAEEAMACMEGDGGGWSSQIQCLISHGHDVAKIPDYTLRQFRGFLKACIDREIAHYKQSVFATRTAGLTEEGFKKVVGSLD